MDDDYTFADDLCIRAIVSSMNRYGHGIFDRSGKDGGGPKKGGGGSGSGIGGNVFWKQWHFPVKADSSLRDDEEEIVGTDGYFDPSDGSAGADYDSTDRRPWTDLIPRFRVKVEPMTTLKVRKG